ncbi:flagellar brake protein [Actinospongicola halichondriae]|uniref:flagellar brake protein n=1 Tax=Actinospongicola halichondriae TaxID=3236844 RepID=UPI003D5558E3
MLEVDTGKDPSAGRSETAARHRYLEPGLTLSVSDLTDSLGGYTCHLTEVDGRTLWIDLPIRRDGMLSLSVGQLVTARFDRPDDAVYFFDSVVSDRRDDDHAPFGLAMPVTINRRPRRTDTRLALVLDASFDSGEQRSVAGKVVDLSAGGVGLICAQELALGDEVVVRCDLPGPDHIVPIEQAATVQTSSLYGRTPGGATLRQYGLRFVGADDQMRERILDTIIWNLTSNPAIG